MQALCLVWIILTSVSRCWILSYLSAKLNNCAFFKILFPTPITTDLRKSALLTFFLMSSKSYLCCLVAMPRFRFEQVARAKFVVLYKAFPCLSFSSLTSVLHYGRGKHKPAQPSFLTPGMFAQRQTCVQTRFWRQGGNSSIVHSSTCA